MVMNRILLSVFFGGRVGCRNVQGMNNIKKENSSSYTSLVIFMFRLTCFLGKISPLHMQLGGGWAGSRTVLGKMKINKPLYYCRESNPSCSVYSHSLE
jgi:hypothetical protein